MKTKGCKIEINNSYSRVTGLDVETLGKLRKAFSYELDPMAIYQGRIPRRKHMVDQRGEFPTGLANKVYAWLDEKSTHKPSCVDLRKRPPKTQYAKRSLQTVALYEDQIEAAYRALLNERGGIVMPTGSGKSMVIAEIIRGLNLKTLVVVPNIEIKNQLKGNLLSFFGDLDNITVENIDSKALKAKKQDYDVLIIDECHHVAAKTYQTLNKKHWGGIYYRFFLSATFYRNNVNEQLPFEGIAGEVVFKLSYHDAVKRGYIVPVEAFAIAMPKQSTDAFTWAEVYSELVVHNKARNERIAECLREWTAMERSTLCLVKEIAHGQKLSELSGVPFANGQDEESRKYIRAFNSGLIDGLIATTGIVGEGVDTKPAEYIIIAGLGKAKSAFMQQVGRGVRRYGNKESAKVILIKDASHKFTINHYREQKKILLDEYGVAVIEFEWTGV